MLSPVLHIVAVFPEGTGQSASITLSNVNYCRTSSKTGAFYMVFWRSVAFMRYLALIAQLAFMFVVPVKS